MYSEQGIAFKERLWAETIAELEFAGVSKIMN